VLAKQTPIIEGKVRELQAELAELQKSATEARRASDDREGAVKNLQERKCWPAFVADRVQQQKRLDVSSFGRDIEALRSKLKLYENLPSLDVSAPTRDNSGVKGGKDLDSVQAYVSGVQSLGPDDRSRVEKMFHCETYRDGCNTHWRVGEIRPDEWKKHLVDVAIMADELRGRVAALEKLEAEAAKQIEEFSSYYVPK